MYRVITLRWSLALRVPAVLPRGPILACAAEVIGHHGIDLALQHFANPRNPCLVRREPEKTGFIQAVLFHPSKQVLGFKKGAAATQFDNGVIQAFIVDLKLLTARFIKSQYSGQNCVTHCF
jgi:hypothetical protein